ncbi:hypothetical protein J6590_060265 [Homalodisca vitripennis]|nr:hypothetical protein J6590_060265 [Homalodisca vitripennis]
MMRQLKDSGEAFAQCIDLIAARGLVQFLSESFQEEIAHCCDPLARITDDSNYQSLRDLLGAIDNLDAAALNNTAKARRQLVFFNRVPKVGSQTFMELLRHLSIRNNFAFHRDRIQRVETIRLAPAEQLGLATMIDQYSTPSVYVKHICFINFTQSPSERYAAASAVLPHTDGDERKTSIAIVPITQDNKILEGLIVNI